MPEPRIGAHGTLEQRMDDQELERDVPTDNGTPFNIRLRGLHNRDPQYANYISVNYDAYAFHIAFAQILGPIFEDQEDRERFAREGWSADVVSRLLIPPEALRQMIGFLQAQLEQFDSQFNAPDESESDEKLINDETSEQAHLRED